MIAETITEVTEKMAKAVEVIKEDFATVRTGRANPALFQKIQVDYYGTPTPLAQLASLQNPEARTIIITPYDKGALKDIERQLPTATSGSEIKAIVGNALAKAWVAGACVGTEVVVYLAEEIDELEALVKLGLTPADALRAAGYTTGIVGKWHLGHAKREYWPIMLRSAPSGVALKPRTLSCGSRK